jgi:hypothetical protein
MENTKGEELFWLNLSGYKDRGVRATSVYPLFFLFCARSLNNTLDYSSEGV